MKYSEEKVEKLIEELSTEVCPENYGLKDLPECEGDTAYLKCCKCWQQALAEGEGEHGSN